MIFVSLNEHPHINQVQLLGMVSTPVKAAILLFPISGRLETIRKEEDVKANQAETTKIDPTIMWIKQTVRNDAVC